MFCTGSEIHLEREEGAHHQKEDYTRLKVALNVVDNYALANVDDLS